MHTAQGGEQARSLSYETGSLVRIDLTTYSSTPNRVFDTPNFGRIFSTQPAREMLLGLRYSF